MHRREFLKKTGKALVLAAASGATGFYFHDRHAEIYHPTQVRKPSFGVPPDITLPGVTLARNENHDLALNASLEAIGGIKRFVRPGERVTIKPNIGWDRTPAQGANTDPELVAAMVRLCLAAGAAEVIVTDISCNDPRRCFLRSGIRDAAEKAGARVILPVDDDHINIDLGGKVLTDWPVLKYFVETDRFINMPIVKHHSLTSCTVGLKNLYGIIGGRRNQLHQSIDQSIVDLAAFCVPTLTVIDATRVLMRGGPQGGSPGDVELHHTVICATDPVAADARAAEFLHLPPDRVSHIVRAQKSGLGKLDYRAAGYKVING